MIELKHGQALVIIGPQGSGKTTRAIEIAKKHGTYELQFMTELLSNTQSRYFPGEDNTVIVEEAFFDVESLVKIKEIIAAKNAPYFIFSLDSHNYPIEMTTSPRFKFIDINKAMSVEASPGLGGCSIELIQHIERELDRVMVCNGFTRTTTTKSDNRMAFNYRQLGKGFTAINTVGDSMKRQPIVPQPNPYAYGVFKVWPLFIWRECECCKQEFRRERGWRYLGGPFHSGHGKWRYLCGSCGPTWIDANTQANRLVCGEMPRNRPPSIPRVQNSQSLSGPGGSVAGAIYKLEGLSMHLREGIEDNGLDAVADEIDATITILKGN